MDKAWANHIWDDDEESTINPPHHQSSPLLTSNPSSPPTSNPPPHKIKKITTLSKPLARIHPSQPLPISATLFERIAYLRHLPVVEPADAVRESMNSCPNVSPNHNTDHIGKHNMEWATMNRLVLSIMSFFARMSMSIIDATTLHRSAIRATRELMLTHLESHTLPGGLLSGNVAPPPVGVALGHGSPKRVVRSRFVGRQEGQMEGEEVGMGGYPSAKGMGVGRGIVFTGQFLPSPSSLHLSPTHGSFITHSWKRRYVVPSEIHSESTEESL